MLLLIEFLNRFEIRIIREIGLECVSRLVWRSLIQEGDAP